MKFSTLAILACSLASTSATYQPYHLRAAEKDEVQECMKKCVKKGDEKSDKVTLCQEGCVTTATTTGRSRSSIGPYGADDLLLCCADCADDQEKTYKKKSKSADEKGCKKGCPEDDDGSCEKACKSEGKMVVTFSTKVLKLTGTSSNCSCFTAKQIESDAASKAKKDYEKCNDKCFKEEFLVSKFKVSSRLTSFLDIPLDLNKL